MWKYNIVLCTSQCVLHIVSVYNGIVRYINVNVFLFSVTRKPGKIHTHRLCPYLDTINRQVLDFDFEKLCSVSLSRINVYACLVCGKYFQG